MGNRIGAVIEFASIQRSSTITRPSNTTQYTVGDVIANVTTNDNLTFSEAVRRKGGTGMVTNARIVSSANQATKLDANLFLFSAAPGEDGDNAAFTPTDAEMLTCLGIVNFAAGNWVAGDITSGAGGNALCQVDNLGIVIKASSVYDIYGVLVANNTYTPVSDEVLTVQLMITQD